jgi:hypothetical protein
MGDYILKKEYTHIKRSKYPLTLPILLVKYSRAYSL